MNAIHLEPLDYFNLAEPPFIAHHVLKPWEEIGFEALKPYIIEEQRHGRASVNIFRVAGTRHPEYAGGSWLDLLRGGRRMNVNLPLFQRNPDYYLEDADKRPFMHYQSLDGGELYIGAEGNHRTCIARFFFFTKGLTVLHGVTLDDYRIDHGFKAACDELTALAAKQALPITLTVHRRHLERQDAADWRLDKFALTARVFDARTHKTHELDLTGLDRFIETMARKPWWKIWH